MKLEDVNPGDLVVKSGKPDAVVYRVGQIGHAGCPTAIELINDNSTVSHSTGFVDVAYLRKPTKEQL